MSQTTETPRRADARRHMAAIAHGDANARTKKAAAENGVTGRTELRWRTPTDAKGSPQDRYAAYLESAQDPWRLLACNRATVMQRSMKEWNKQQISDRIHELHGLSAISEGEDNAARCQRDVAFLDRATLTERDASFDLELAALYRECAARGYTEEEILGRWPQ